MTGIHKHASSNPEKLPPNTNPHYAFNNPWWPHWPNSADFPYNYFNLLSMCPKGIANVTNTEVAKQRIAIIGAGCGGLTTARELLRCGYEDITIFEATNRIAGRTHTFMPEVKPGHENKAKHGITPFEFGAMRIPLFKPEDSEYKGFGNSMMHYYIREYNQQYQDFPDPGASFINTGIWMNGGFGPKPDDITGKFVGLIKWAAGQEIPNADLKAIYTAWNNWATAVIHKCHHMYTSADVNVWYTYWNKFLENYWSKNFRDVALAPFTPEKADEGDFGGLGLTVEQSSIFYTIGAGDGSWGAFYDVGSLFPVRTLLFGFGTDHKLLGYIWRNSLPNDIPATVTDSAGHVFQSPLFAGVAAIPEMHLFSPIKSYNPKVDGKSLYECIHMKNSPIKLFTSSPVTDLDYHASSARNDSHYILTYKSTDVSRGTDVSESKQIIADHLVFTQTGWSMQMNVNWSHNFTKNIFIEGPGSSQRWPALTSWESLRMSHNITSAKIFFKLKARFWEDGLEQVFTTDTFLQDVYGYAINTDKHGVDPHDPGVLLVTYTWEDDANKFLSSHTDEQDEKLAQKCLDHMDTILREDYEHRGRAAGEKLYRMSDYIDTDFKPAVWHWAEQEFYRSCGKLYRAGSYDWNYALLSWNQDHSIEKRLYMAGEFASLEGGWIEPAFRGAIDTVIHIVKADSLEDPYKYFANKEMIMHYPRLPRYKLTPNKSGSHGSDDSGPLPLMPAYDEKAYDDEIDPRRFIY